MNHEETKKIIRIICASYPNFKPTDIKETLDVWEYMLSDYTYEQVSVALKTIVTTDLSEFAPSISKIIDKIHKLAQMSFKTSLNGIEAWGLVLKAIGRGAYNAESEFEKLPPNVQKAVGSSGNIRAMATDNNFNMGVEQSHFLKAYERAVNDSDYEQRMPKDVRAMLERGGLVNGNDRIGDTQPLPQIKG